MSCYAGSLDPSGLTLEAWHADESFYDSLTGKSPLMQLCRIANLARVELSLSNYSFHRIGTDTSDTSFAVVDYELNPSWNPLDDYKILLGQINSVLLDLFNYQLGPDCYYRRYVAGSLITDYSSAVSGSSLDYKEDWQIFINAIRDLLEGMALVNIQTKEWSTVLLYYGVSSEISWSNAGIYGMFAPGSVHPYDDSADYSQMRFGKTGLDEYNLHGSATYGCGRTYTDYAGTTIYTAKDINPFSGPPTASYESHLVNMKHLGAGFNNALFTMSRGDYYVTQMTYNSLWPSPGPPIALYCDQEISNLGWWTTEEFTFTFRVSRSGAGFVSGEPHPSDGYTVGWSIDETQTDPSNPISYTLSASSGTITWAEGQEYEDIAITATLTDANVGANWSSGDSFSSVTLFNKSVYFSVALDKVSDSFCSDACDNIHEDV